MDKVDSQVIASRIDEWRKHNYPESTIEYWKVGLEWLMAHQVAFEEPDTVTLNNFTFNYEKLTGQFLLSLDSIILMDKFDFRLDGILKKLSFSSPLLNPPQFSGLYHEYFLTDKTSATIRSGLNQLFLKDFSKMPMNQQVRRMIEDSMAKGITVRLGQN